MQIGSVQPCRNINEKSTRACNSHVYIHRAHRMNTTKETDRAQES